MVEGVAETLEHETGLVFVGHINGSQQIDLLLSRERYVSFKKIIVRFVLYHLSEIIRYINEPLVFLLLAHHVKHIVKDVSNLLHLNLATSALRREATSKGVGVRGACFLILHSHHFVLELLHVLLKLLSFVV